MDWTEDQIAIGREFGLAIERDQVDVIQAFCAKHPWLLTDYQWNGKQTWLNRAAIKGNLSAIQVLLDLGFKIDALRLPEKSTALSTAVGFKHLDLARLLLKRNANPNLGRALITAINCDDSKLRFTFVKLLVEHGANVNLLFDLYGDKDQAFSALDWAKNDPAVAEYLVAHGAKPSGEIRAAGYSVDVPPAVDAFAGK